MSDHSVSLRRFLEERRLARKEASGLSRQIRKSLENSRLLELVDGTYDTLNREAGAAIIEGHAYVPPECVLRTFTFVKDRAEYVMRLDLWGVSPALVFLVRRWRDSSSSAFLRWVCRLIELEPLTMEIKFAGEINEETISEQEVQKWFFYLLSGLDRSYKPELRRLKIPDCVE